MFLCALFFFLFNTDSNMTKHIQTDSNMSKHLSPSRRHRDNTVWGSHADLALLALLVGMNRWPSLDFALLALLALLV